MPIILSLLTNDDIKYQVFIKFTGDINIHLLNNILLTWNLTCAEISNIKFIIDNNQLTDISINYSITSTEKKLIYIYTKNPNLLIKLKDSFIRINNMLSSNSQFKESIPESIDNSIGISITDQQHILINMKNKIEKGIFNINNLSDDNVQDNLLSRDIINDMNEKTKTLFMDDDFKSLLSIYIKRPKLYGIFLKYIENTDMIENNLINTKTVDDISEIDLNYYSNLCEEIKKLNINFDNITIINRLIKYSGHLNLTLRSLLLDKLIT